MKWGSVQHFQSQFFLWIGSQQAHRGISGSGEGPPGRVRSIMQEKTPEDSPTGKHGQLETATEHGLHV